MTDKRIRNEQWYVKELVSRISKCDIIKPKFQRKQKWDITFKKESIPNEQSYIQFLFDTHNSVDAITFGNDMINNKMIYSNIDGNNRINAIMHFTNRPFDLFPHYLKHLFNLLDTVHTTETEMKEIKQVFCEMSYSDIIGIKTPDRYFRQVKKSMLYAKIRDINTDIEDEVEKIQELLKINGEKEFDTNVKVNVNIFEGYTTDELCKVFVDINKYNSKLTETELLGSRLYTEINFTFEDPLFRTELIEQIKKDYYKKSEGEVLQCYTFKDNDPISGYDFVIGFQNLCHSRYKIIEKTDYVGLSLFFKTYKLLYTLNDSFTTENVNDFIKIITFCCEILKEVISEIFTDKINSSLFNKSCEEKVSNIRKNTLYMILSSLIGFHKQKKDRASIKKSLEKCILFHFMVSDMSVKENRDLLKTYDSIAYDAGGNYIENITKKYLQHPETISNKITRRVFEDLIDNLCVENNSPYDRFLDEEKKKHKNDKRRKLSFWTKTLMFYYYKENVPTNFLNNNFSIEHIIPNSSVWDNQLDKDRIGNLVPIIASMNISRSNKHISHYTEIDSQNFFQFMKTIIPSTEEYDKIMNHHERKAKVIDNKAYDDLCIKIQNLYKNNFMKCLYEE